MAQAQTSSTGQSCQRCNAWRGSLGLEPTPDCAGWATGEPCGTCYVCHVVEVFRGVRRVLRDDGVVFLNMGDSYYGAGYSNSQTLKPKDLVGIPWRVALALQADGWWLRSDIIWAKGLSFCPEYAGSVMPESVRDRPTSAHEHVFLLTKSARYFYDAEAVQEPLRRPDKLSSATPAVFGGANKHDGYNTRKHSGNEYINNPGGRNLRNVWAINPQPYPEAHFATFSEKLVRPMILAGSSAKGCCPECGAPWKRMVETDNPSKAANVGLDLLGGAAKTGNPQTSAGLHRNSGGVYSSRKILGWRPTCGCNAGDPVPQTILDPFAGAGTTGIMAAKLGRRFVGIELNESYVEMAYRRYNRTWETEVEVNGKKRVYEQVRLIP